MAKPGAFLGSWPQELAPTFGPYRAVLDRWVDADTGLFLVDLGFGHYVHIAIRLDGYSSAEKWTDEGKAAIAFANDLAPPGSRALIYSRDGSFDPTFDRWDGSILLERGLDYGEALFVAGHAIYDPY